jgi:hypothetical protein
MFLLVLGRSAYILTFAGFKYFKAVSGLHEDIFSTSKFSSSYFKVIYPQINSILSRLLQLLMLLVWCQPPIHWLIFSI